MADTFSPWVKPNNQLRAPKGVSSGWSGVMSPQAQLQNFGSFAGDDPPPAPPQTTQPVQLGHYQGQGTTINGQAPAGNGQPPLKVDISGAHFYGKSPPAPIAPPPRPRAAPTFVPTAQAPAQPPAATNDDWYGPDDTTYQKLLANLDEANVSGIGEQKKGLSDQEARLADMRAREPKVDLSPLLAYQDTTQGTNLSAGYKRPKTQDELDQQADGLQELIQKNRQGLSDDQIKILDNALNAEGRRLGIDESSMQRAETAKAVAALQADTAANRLGITVRGQDLSHADRRATNARVAAGKPNTAYQKLIHDTNPSLASSRSDLGRNQAVSTSAQKIQALGAQGATQAGGLTPSQMEELAASTAALLQNGSAGAQGTIRRLVPKTIGGDAASLKSYIKGLPVGAGQQAFVDQMLETARREQELAQDNIKKAQTSAYKDAKTLLTPEQAAEYGRNHPHVLEEGAGAGVGTGSAPNPMLDAIRAEQARRAAAGSK